MASSCRHLVSSPVAISTVLAAASRCRVSGCKASLESCWLCLQCGAVSCGKLDGGHAQQHFKETQHPVAIGVASAQVWCYVCDDEVLDEDGGESGESLVGASRAAVIRQRAQRQQLQADSSRSPSQTAADVASPQSRAIANFSAALNTYAPTAGLTGLQNLGNTCFLAAALQALSHVPAFALYFSECGLAARQATEGTMPVAMQALMQASWQSLHTPEAMAATARGGWSYPYYTPSAVMRALRRANPIFDVRRGAGACFVA